MLQKKPSMSLLLAKTMVEASEEKARQQGWKMNIAVVDDGANLVLFEHMDGAFLGSVGLAQRKAMTSANFPIPTRQFATLAFGKARTPGVEPGIADVPDIVAIAGGLPIMTVDNVHIGGIGVSGGISDDQDEACAQAGLDAVKDQLVAAE
jgi:glc operon protein GlcG